MRELKFRAWLNKEKEMVEVKSIHLSTKKIMYGRSGKYNYGNKAVNIDEVMLMQFTGVKDKNNREICEGDVAKLPAYLTNYTQYAVCKWIDNTNSVEDVIGFAFEDMSGKRVRNDEWEDYEIIGNIFENSELLGDE